jgi:hypothetical protein
MKGDLWRVDSGARELRVFGRQANQRFRLDWFVTGPVHRGRQRLPRIPLHVVMAGMEIAYFAPSLQRQVSTPARRIAPRT